jgi:hypothetical protein
VNFRPGQIVRVPCEIQQGAFAGEYLVTIHPEEGILTGFADASAVRLDDKSKEKGSIRATLVELSPVGSKVKVRIDGSFFTIAAGTAFFSADWAKNHRRA